MTLTDRQLDARLDAAARGLRHAVAAVPAPDLVPGGDTAPAAGSGEPTTGGLAAPGAARRPDGGRPRLAPRLVVGIAAVVLVVAGAVVAALRSGPDEAPVVMEPPAPPAYLLEGQPPELDFATAAEPADGPLPGGGMTTTVYGDRGAQEPFAEADAAVEVRRLPSGAAMTTDEEDADEVPVTVRGHEGLAGVFTAGSPQDGLRFVSWPERDGLLVRVSSWTLGEAQLLDLAQDVVVDGDEVRLGEPPDGLPGPLDRLGSWVLPDALRPGAPRTATVGYGGHDDGTGEGPRVIVTTIPGGDDLVAVLRWGMRADEATTIRGHEAWFRPAGGARSDHTLVWQEQPGVVIQLSGSDVTPDELAALADGLRPASEQEWDDLTVIEDAPAD